VARGVDKGALVVGTLAGADCAVGAVAVPSLPGRVLAMQPVRERASDAVTKRKKTTRRAERM
jgi:hypothetical protein